jgi:hypothetical protein
MRLGQRLQRGFDLQHFFFGFLATAPAQADGSAAAGRAASRAT